MRLVFIMLAAMMIGGGASLGCRASCDDRVTAVREAQQERNTFRTDETLLDLMDAVTDYCNKCTEDQNCWVDYFFPE